MNTLPTRLRGAAPDAAAAAQLPVVRRRPDRGSRAAHGQPPVPDAPARLLGADEHLGKPIIAILNTWSDINPCHMHLRERAQQVKRGVWQAGGFPLEFPVATLSETFQKPTPMLYRNLLAMETEELLRSYPVDGAVLMGGCDKTTPALLMGAASAGIPAIYVPAGPMLRGNCRGTAAGQRHRPVEVLGRLPGRADRRLRAGRARERHRPLARALHDHGHRLHHDLGRRGAGHDPARRRLHPGRRLGALPDGRRPAASGRSRWCGRTSPRATILTREAFEDAAATVLALGGSTNALIHLIAMAGRCGVPLTLDDFDVIARRVPVLANIRPGGRVPDGGLLLRGRPARAARPARHRPRGPAHRPPDRRPAPRWARTWPPPPCTTRT